MPNVETGTTLTPEKARVLYEMRSWTLKPEDSIPRDGVIGDSMNPKRSRRAICHHRHDLISAGLLFERNRRWYLDPNLITDRAEAKLVLEVENISMSKGAMVTLAIRHLRISRYQARQVVNSLLARGYWRIKDKRHFHRIGLGPQAMFEILYLKTL